MGYLSRTPTENDLPAVPENKWGPVDEVGALLIGTAVRCCTCREVTSQEHVTIHSGHAFCPDHQREALCTYGGECQDNVSMYIELSYPGRSCGGSSDASDAD